jgi:DNA-directed RNA polymerase subunit RPC12/RpoP
MPIQLVLVTQEVGDDFTGIWGTIYNIAMTKKWPKPEIEHVTEPFCGRRRKNSIPLSIFDPDLATEWCHKKNYGWGADDFSHGSNVRAWWVCPQCNREYKARIEDRTLHHTACPYCASRKVCKENSLATRHPKIARQWHPTLNGDLTPHKVTAHANMNAWWLCRRGIDHIWNASIDSRIRAGCPYCSGYKIGQQNNLKVLFPDVAAQWHSSKNGKLKPENVSPGSHELMWWICLKGLDHVWQATAKNRTERGSGCPFCIGKQVSVINSLASLFPKIARQWHKTKNGKLRSFDVTSKTDRVVWWQCQSGHSWQQRIANRTTRLGGCPICKKAE